MIAFEIYVNGQKVCTAGSAGLDALTTGITFSRPKQPAQREAGTYLTIGGVVIEPEEIVNWDHRQLHIGDMVEVRVVDASEVDEPKTRDHPRSCGV